MNFDDIQDLEQAFQSGNLPPLLVLPGSAMEIQHHFHWVILQDPREFLFVRADGCRRLADLEELSAQFGLDLVSLEESLSFLPVPAVSQECSLPSAALLPVPGWLPGTLESPRAAKEPELWSVPGGIPVIRQTGTVLRIAEICCCCIKRETL